MKKILSFMLWATALTGFISCSDDDPVASVELVNVQKLNNRFATKIFSFDGMETDASGTTFEFLNGTPAYSDVIHEADLEMTLPAKYQISTTESQFYAPMKFKVHAISSEDRITFSGDYLQGVGDVKLYVEGVYKVNNTVNPTDTLYINMRRESPQAPFAGKTYELVLEENTIDLEDFEDNGLAFEGDRPVVEQAEEGFVWYMEYLRDSAHTTSYLFDFQTEGTLDIKKHNPSKNAYESIPGRFKYYVADNEYGFIEMDIEAAERLINLLCGRKSHNGYYNGVTDNTYLFEDVITMTFCYRFTSDGLSLAIGDKTYPHHSMKDMLSEWQDMGAGAHYLNDTRSFLSLYMSWSNNIGDQIWWRLKEK